MRYPFFLTGHNPAWLDGVTAWLEEALDIEGARRLKAEREKAGYTNVTIWERPLSVKVE